MLALRDEVRGATRIGIIYAGMGIIFKKVEAEAEEV